MKNAPLIAHVIVAITTTTTFLFQMATLIDINTYSRERIASLKRKTYIRSTIKNEAAAWARYEGS